MSCCDVMSMQLSCGRCQNKTQVGECVLVLLSCQLASVLQTLRVVEVEGYHLSKEYIEHTTLLNLSRHKFLTVCLTLRHFYPIESL